jgi:hypothetical protein
VLPQRAFIAMIQAIEQEEMQAAIKAGEMLQNAPSDREIARALAAFIGRTKHKYERDENSEREKS